MLYCYDIKALSTTYIFGAKFFVDDIHLEHDSHVSLHWRAFHGASKTLVIFQWEAASLHRRESDGTLWDPGFFPVKFKSPIPKREENIQPAELRGSLGRKEKLQFM